MKSAFTCGQHPHQKEKAINNVINLWDEMRQDEFIREFEECIRILCHQDYRSKYTRDCLSFVVDCAARLNQEFSEGTKKFVGKVEFLEYLCVLISLWKKSHSMDFRFNSSHLLGLLSENMEELDDKLVRKLSKLFQDYFTDIKHPIRYVAASHLFKFQNAENPKDPANMSYRFHALRDSSAEVRLRCVQRMCLKLPYDDVIIRLTRDRDEKVRATAFKRAAISFEFRSLPDNERSKLIKSISAEKSEKVLVVIKEQLMTKLIEAFEYDISALLGSFGYPDEKKDAEHFIDLALESLLESEKKAPGQMERFVKKFSKNCLNTQRLIRSNTISFQSIISWHKLIRFIQKNEDLLEPDDRGEQYDLESKDPLNGSAISSQEQIEDQFVSQTTKSSLKSTRTPLVYYLIPEFPHFCSFVTSFVESVEDCGREEEAPLVLENLVFEEFISMIDCFDLFDSAYKNALLNTLNRFIHFEALVYYFPDYISTIIKCLSTHLFTCSRDSLVFIARARESLMNEGIPDPESINNISSAPMEEEDDDQYSRVIDRIGDLRDRLEIALEANDLENADSITKEIRELDRKKKELMTRKSSISVDGSGFRSSDAEDDDDRDEVKRKSRNLSEKKRRDQFNMLINELCSMVNLNQNEDLTCQGNKKMDKSSILRATISFLKNHSEENNRAGRFESVDNGSHTDSSGHINHSLINAWKPSFLSTEEFSHLSLEALDAFVLVFETDPNGSILYVSESILPLLGFSPASVVPGHRSNASSVDNDQKHGHQHSPVLCESRVSVYDLIHESERSSLRKLVSEAMDRSKSDHNDGHNFVSMLAHFRYRSSAPERESIESSGIHELIRIVGTVRRIEESSNAGNRSCFVSICRLQAPKLLKELHVLMPIFSDSYGTSRSNEFVSRHSLEWKFLFLDHRAPTIIGYLPFEVLGTSGYDYYHWDDLDLVVAGHQQLMQTGASTSCHYRFLTKGQQWIWLKTKYYITYHMWNSKPEFVVCTHTVIGYANILKKTPFSSEDGGEKTASDATTTDESIKGTSENESKKSESSTFNIGAGLVDGFSGYLKTTFKGNPSSPPASADASNPAGDDGSEYKESGETQDPNGSETRKKESTASAIGSGLMNTVLKTTSFFKSDAGDAKTKGSSDICPDSTPKDENSDETVDKSTPTEQISQKAVGSAKTFGNFLFNVANKAGQTVTATATKLKQTVEQNTLLADFTKEQQEFIKEHGGNIDVGKVPWAGCENEEEVKQQIISLSQDKRNFVRSPPSGASFEFDMQNMLPVALGLLKHDPNLETMRFDLVPKLVNEETFWRNYFYRVQLIKQSTSSSNTNKGCKGWASSSSSSAEGPDDPSPTNPEPEFISDTIQGSVSDEDLQSGMRQLGLRNENKVGSMQDDQRWEDEINKDLQEFEVVNKDGNNGLDDDLESELAQL
ncbi:uncharacterized protein LOC141853933 [Brevipalpus obovatus]|uniref:uncharacterized protein LOC141853933 n=1 Tax=Brevipalpus obovatus TaxID=246614 RepID=UPI003D9F8C50